MDSNWKFHHISPCFSIQSLTDTTPKYFTMHLLRLRTYSYVKTVNNFLLLNKGISNGCFQGSGVVSCPWKRVWTKCSSKRWFSTPYLQPLASEPQTLRCSITPPSQSKSPILPNNHLVIKKFAAAPKACF